MNRPVKIVNSIIGEEGVLDFRLYPVCKPVPLTWFDYHRKGLDSI